MADANAVLAQHDPISLGCRALVILDLVSFCHLFGSSNLNRVCAYFDPFASGKHLNLIENCGKTIG
jgi:hypothetical protein